MDKLQNLYIIRLDSEERKKKSNRDNSLPYKSQHTRKGSLKPHNSCNREQLLSTLKKKLKSA